VVLRAGGTNPDAAQVALEQLCRDYWHPLYAYVRRKGHSPEDAGRRERGSSPPGAEGQTPARVKILIDTDILLDVAGRFRGMGRRSPSRSGRIPDRRFS
jgi:hypothetical protein